MTARRETRPRVVFSVECRAARFRRRPLRAVLERVLLDHGRTRGTLSVAVVGDAAIHRLNREFLGHDRPTDVISFPFDGDSRDDPAPEEDAVDTATDTTVDAASDAASEDDTFGELVLSAETAVREAKRRGWSPGEELSLYAVHGTLHLVGYDDADPISRRRMRARERRYMSLLRSLLDRIQPPPRTTSPS